MYSCKTKGGAVNVCLVCRGRELMGSMRTKVSVDVRDKMSDSSIDTAHDLGQAVDQEQRICVSLMLGKGQPTLGRLAMHDV